MNAAKQPNAESAPRGRCRSAECLITTLHHKGIPRGVILDAFRYIPRDCFVPDEQRPFAWEDRPLPIGDGQTVSQPYTVAYMFRLAGVGPGDRVLDVGTGSGYAAALLSYIVGTSKLVTTVEVRPELAAYAKRSLAAVGMSGITVTVGDAKRAKQVKPPFDTILVGAQAPEIPEVFIEYLAQDGRLVMPIESDGYAVMTCVHKTATGTEITRHDAFQFVPLV
ncbi:MAG: methyltransferase domain-containing protein [Spirochaeta sp.]|jgi:protein-L-isoaspartate(D-aspartate) O-methyltransferase|nr:methyltransferase domain-containing protein [Spirochaeta sp.]